MVPNPTLSKSSKLDTLWKSWPISHDRFPGWYSSKSLVVRKVTISKDQQTPLQIACQIVQTRYCKQSTKVVGELANLTRSIPGLVFVKVTGREQGDHQQGLAKIGKEFGLDSLEKLHNSCYHVQSIRGVRSLVKVIKGQRRSAKCLGLIESAASDHRSTGWWRLTTSIGS